MASSIVAGTSKLRNILAHDAYRRGVRKALLLRDQLRQFTADGCTQQRANAPLPLHAQASAAVEANPTIQSSTSRQHPRQRSRQPSGWDELSALHRSWASYGLHMTTHQRVALLYKLGRACGSHAKQPMAAALVREVLATLDPSGFCSKDLSLCLSAAARAQCSADDPALSALLQHLAHAPPSFLAEAAPQALSNMAWALSKLRCRDPLAWNPLALAAEGAVQQFKPIDVANLAYALAASGVLERDPDWGIPLLGLLARQATQQAGRFNPQDLSNTAWAFAKAGMRNLPLFNALGEAALPLLPQFNGQALANIAWAHAAVGYAPATTMEGIRLEVAVRIASSPGAHSSYPATTTSSMMPQRLSPTQLSVLAWALQRSGRATRELLGAMAEVALVQLPAFQTFELGRLLCAMAGAAAYDGDFFAVACSELLARPAADLQDLRTTVTLLRSLSLAGHYEPQLVERVLRLLQATWLGEEGLLQGGRALVGGAQLAEEEAVALGLVAACLGSLRHYDQRTLHLLAAVVEAQASVAPAAVQPFLLTAVLSAHAFFGHRSPRLFVAASTVVSTNPGAFQLPQVCHLLWAAGAGCYHNPRLLRTVFQQLAKYERDAASLRPVDAGRVVHGMAYLEAAMSPAAWQRLVEQQPPPWTLVLAATELFCSSQEVVTSDLQRSLAAALRGMGLEAAQEARTHDEIFVTDLLVTWKGVKVAIEADGPTHTTANQPERMVGPWALKDLCLMHRGYAVARIPARRWAAARRARQVTELLTACMDAAVDRLHAYEQRRQARSVIVDAPAADKGAGPAQDVPAADPGLDGSRGAASLAAGGSGLEQLLGEVAALDDVAMGFHVRPRNGSKTGKGRDRCRVVSIEVPHVEFASMVPVRAPKKRRAEEAW